MPRTVCEIPATLAGDPNFGTPEFARAVAEEDHHSTQQRYFEYPLVVDSSPCGDELNRPLSFRHKYDVEYSTNSLGAQTAEDCRRFCFKDCAIYVSSPSSHVWFRKSFFDAVYREWFPNRAEDCDISYGSFFGYLVSLYNEQEKAVTLAEILGFHAALCAKLSALVGHVPTEAPLHAAQLPPFRDGRPTTPPRNGLYWPPTEYKLRDTFEKCFIVVEAGKRELKWNDSSAKKDGVLLVWRNGGDALKHGCAVDEARGITAWNGGDLGCARVFRCSLERAMQLVVATDEERRAGREWNECLKEWLGEQGER